MELRRFGTGPIGTNCYVISDEGEAAVIDPAAFPPALKEYIDSNALKVKYVLLTHAHFDHTLGVEAVKQYTGAKVVLGRGDTDMINDPDKNGGNKWSLSTESVVVDITADDGDIFEIGNIGFSVINTPGHSKGCVCYYCKDKAVLFAGDTLFAGSVGRTDLYGGSMNELITSVTQRLYTLPDDTEVFPGHGEFTTIGEEKLSNGVITV